MKKVLIISYYFPPIGGVGSIRIVKFVKYLSNFGWQPIVLTVDSKDDYYIDGSLLEEIPDVKIYRTKLLPFIHDIFKRKKEVLKEKKEVIKEPKGIRKFLGEHLYIPDNKIRWYPYAVKKGIEIIKNENIDIIFTSGAPFSVHLIGLKLKKITKKPWVVDFRDPWIGHPYLDYPSFISKWIQIKLEKNVIKRADKVISATQPITENFIKRYNKLPKEKFITITNGYDKDDFKGITIQKNINKKEIIITYLGSIYNAHPIKDFLLALKKCQEEDANLSSKLKIRIVGLVDDVNKNYINEIGLNALIEIIPWQPHKESLKYLFEGDVLLLLLAYGKGSDMFYTGKIFEYLMAKKPILALIPEGILSNLIKELNVGFVISPEDVNIIYRFIIDLINNKINLNINFNEDRIKQFERKELTKKLADIFQEIV